MQLILFKIAAVTISHLRFKSFIVKFFLGRTFFAHTTYFACN